MVSSLNMYLEVFYGATAPSGPRPLHFRGLTITLGHTTLGRTPLGEWSSRSRDLYLTTQHSHKKQTSLPPAVLEPTISARERPQTDAIDCAATGIGMYLDMLEYIRITIHIRLYIGFIYCVLWKVRLPPTIKCRTLAIIERFPVRFSVANDTCRR
jgi:hypothetical protein